MDNKNIFLFFFFLVSLGIINFLTYYKYNVYTKYDIWMILLFTSILFVFLYIFTNLFISQYKLINIDLNDENSPLKIEDNKKSFNIFKIISLVFILIFYIIFLINIIKNIYNNQYKFINNKYKLNTLISSTILIPIFILLLYFIIIKEKID